MKGVINLYKEKGMTSSDAVVKARKILGIKAVGHMGTLDPQGEGVLLLGVGKATRLFDYFLSKDKEYEAEFTYGAETDTLDGEGKVVRTDSFIPTAESVAAKLGELVGEQMQLPPLYSAKSLNGTRAYVLARRNEPVELKRVKITVYSAELIEAKSPTFRVRIRCSAGTYIRSICRDLAYLTGGAACMTAIKRTRCGVFSAENAVTLAELSQKGEAALVSAENALAALPRVEIPSEYKKQIDNGVKVLYDAPETFALYCGGEFYGIGVCSDGYVGIKTYLKD